MECLKVENGKHEMYEHVKVYPVKDFERLRSEFLDNVDLKDGYYLYSDYDSYSGKFDKQTNNLGNKDDKYKELFMEMVSEPISNYCRQWNCGSVTMGTVWTHKYTRGGYYQHHTHTFANMGGVIHLVLEDEDDYTHFPDNPDLKIKEGEDVLFTSMHPHACMPVKGNKIVLSFNWDMHGDMTDYDKSRVKIENGENA